MTIFYFTGTGNSLFAARKLSEHTGAALVSIPAVFDVNREYVDDCIGFVYPQYAIGIPKMVRKFVLGNSFKADYIFAVDLYAFFRLGALGELAAIIPLNYGAYLKTPNNFTLALSPPKDPLAVLQSAELHLSDITKDVIARKENHIRPRKGEGNATKYFGKTRFKLTDECNLCGTCSKVCPARNITVDMSVAFGNKCENCFSCANLCPRHAIHSNNAMLKRKQYQNPLVTLNEIVAANNRTL